MAQAQIGQAGFDFLQGMAIVKPSLADKFGIPPFSVFDARQGYWQDRKRMWLALGIQSELGRGESAGNKLIMSETIQHLKPSADQALKHSRNPGRCYGQDLMRGENPNFGRADRRLTWVTGNRAEEDLDESSRKNLAAQPVSGISIFDPVLCELIYRWFCPKSGKVLDPYAGGSVRGIVAAYMGLDYTGIELRSSQIEANRIQAQAIINSAYPAPRWIQGDAFEAPTLAPGSYDLIFSCPPYFDLERYSDLPGELSALPSYTAFRQRLQATIHRLCPLLNPNRFACFVVGDIRDEKGFYRGFVSHTVQAFENAGMQLYNDAILLTAVGSLPIRVSKQFGAYRKLGKTHQNVLIFFKGNPQNIPDIFGEQA